MNTRDKLEICKELIESRLSGHGVQRQMVIKEDRLIIECGSMMLATEVRIYSDAANTFRFSFFIDADCSSNTLQVTIFSFDGK